MASTWLKMIQDAEKTAIIEDGKKKVHYKFTTGEEMAEEYNLETNIVMRRAWKNNKNIRKTQEWTIEIGDPEFQPPSVDSVDIKEDASAPYVVRRITKTSLEWRIRNLPYPISTYSVTAEPNEKCITVRTSNKKYFKKIQIPELERVGLLPEQNCIEFTHKFNTLIITYKKPKEVLQMENLILEELRNVKTIKEGELPCNPS